VNVTGVAEEKRRLRAWARAQRAGLPDVSPAVTAHLAAWLRALGARRVLAYRAFAGEPDVSGLAGAFELFTTRANWRPEPHLTVHPWESATFVNRVGILEPPRDAPGVDAGLLDAVLVPGLAFDASGVRLGYGGGFYDRFLAGLRVPCVGVIQEALVLPGVPAEPHDACLPFLATEGGVRRTMHAPDAARWD